MRHLGSPPASVCRERTNEVILWVDLLVALVVSLLLVSAFGLAKPYYDAGLDVLTLFLLLFLATWALGAWFRPIGPPFWGSYFVGYLLVGLVVALFLTSALQASGGQGRRKVAAPSQDPQAAEAVVVTFGIVFWVFLVVSLIAIALSYLL